MKGYCMTEAKPAKVNAYENRRQCFLANSEASCSRRPRNNLTTEAEATERRAVDSEKRGAH